MIFFRVAAVLGAAVVLGAAAVLGAAVVLRAAVVLAGALAVAELHPLVTLAHRTLVETDRPNRPSTIACDVTGTIRIILSWYLI